tara:strand:+ start:484 stop:2643 length:2160 start_codon:yes stop_codon:yes gene_type:complete
MSASVKTISIIVAANIKGLEKGMGKANKSMAKFASNAARTGSLLSFAVTAPLVALGKSAMDTFVQFENGMAKVGTVTNATTDELKMLTSEAKRLGSTTQFTASQVAELQLTLGRKGFNPEAIKNMEQSVLDLSLATGEDLNLAAQTVGSSLRAFGRDATDAKDVANTLALATSRADLKLSTFSTAFANAGASASAVGVDLEELAAMMGVLMNSGIKASKAGTGLNSLFITLKEKGISLSDTLDMLSEGQMGLDRATAIVGKNFSKQLLILSKNRDETKELTKEYKNNTTGLDDMAKKMGQTTQAKIKRMSSAIEGLQLEFGALIADALTPLINKITELASNFTNLDDETKKTILTIAGIAVAIGPVLILIAGAVSTFGMLGTAIGALVSPIGLAVAALVVLPIAFKYIIDNWEAFTERLGDWSWWQNAIIKVLQWVLKYNPFSVILEGAQGLYDFLGIKAEVYNPFDELAESLEGLKVETKEYKHEFGDVMDSIKDGMKNLDIELPSIFGNAGGGNNQKKKKKKEGGGAEKEYTPFGFGPEFEEYLEQLRLADAATQRWVNASNEFGLSIATSFSDSFANVLVSGGNLLQGLGQIFVDLGKQIASMIIKAAVLAALLSVTGLGSKAMASGGIFKTGSGFSDILKGMMGGAFAEGGRPPVGKMSLVGERGPELFVPGSSGTIIPNHAMGGGGGAVIPDVRITGDDLLIVFDRAQRRKARR